MTSPDEVAGEKRASLRFLTDFVTRRWILLLAGLVAGFLTGAVALASTSSGFAAESTFVIVNPVTVGSPTEIKAATDQAAQLMPTIAQLARSDEVIAAVRKDAQLPETIPELRARVSSSVPYQTFLVVTRIELDTADQANTAMGSFKTQFAAQVARFGGSTPFVAFPIQDTAAETTKRGSGVVLLASIIGLTLAAAVAFVLDDA